MNFKPVSFLWVFLFFLVLFADGGHLVYSVEAEFLSTQNPAKIPQGEVVLLSLPLEIQGKSVEGTLSGRRVLFFPDPDSGRMTTLIGADLLDKPAQEELVVTVTATGEGSPVEYRFPVEILPVEYPTQEISVDKKYVDLDPETLKRVQKEQKRIIGTMNHVSPIRIWNPPFIRPVEGKVSGAFGKRRVFNGQPRKPHSGEDFAAPKGTEIRSSTEGVVALVGDFFFTGKSVFLDHGLGLYSMFFHLETIKVRQGDRIERGQILGTVGSSGRATGPHLHWGMRLNGARVNPLSFLEIR